MIIATPLMESQTYLIPLTPAETGLEPVHELAALEPLSQDFNDTLLYYATVDKRMLFVSVHGVSDAAIDSILGTIATNVNVLRHYRQSETDSTQVTTCYDSITHQPTLSNDCLSYAYFDNRAAAVMDAAERNALGFGYTLAPAAAAPAPAAGTLPPSR